MSRRAPFLIAAVVLGGLIAVFSALPTEMKHALHLQGPLHPWLHFLGFAALAALLLSAIRSAGLQVITVAVLLLFGYATEAGESRKDGWPIERRDVRTDAAGVLLGAAVAFLPILRRKG